MNKTKKYWIDEAIKNYNTGDYENALIACEQAIQLDATFARAFHGKGLVLMQQKKYREALEAYRKAQRLAPQNAKIYCDMGELCYKLKEYGRSGRCFRKAMELDDKYRQIYSEKLQHLVDNARDLRSNGRDEEADTKFQQVLSFNPSSTIARDALHLSGKTSSPYSASITSSIDTQPFSSDRLSEAAHNNQWDFKVGKVHPFNCRCKDCVAY